MEMRDSKEIDLITKKRRGDHPAFFHDYYINKSPFFPPFSGLFPKKVAS